MEKITRNEVIESDFIISLGPACRVAHYLRENNLRYVANPLDWMMNYNLESVIHWFKNDFDDFFLDIQEETKNETNGYRWIIDRYSGAVSIHHFPVNIDIKNNHEKFSRVMRKRSSRMKKIIKKSNKILFISNRKQPKKDFYHFLREFNEIYDKNTLYLNIRDEKTSFKKYTKTLSKDLRFIEYVFEDVHKDGSIKEINPNFWIGNDKKWNEIMKMIKLNPNSKFLSKKKIDGKIIR